MKPVIIRGALDEDICKLIEVYCLIEEKRSELYGDGVTTREKDIAGVYSLYADPMTESMMLLLIRRIEKETGLNLFPTYSFYRIYRNGHSLIKHVDREACEISASIFLGKGYTGNNWPLFIDGQAISLNVGDMVVYKGTELTHWREPFSSNGYHVQAFLHYVDADGPYAEYKFDKRKSLFHKDRETLTADPQSAILY